MEKPLGMCWPLDLRYPLSSGFVLCLAAWSIACGGQVAAAESPAGDAGPSGPRVSFTPEERQSIDEGALWGPRERRNIVPLETYGSAHKWVLAHTPLPIQEERTRAAADHRMLKQRGKTGPPPSAASQIFQNLVETLPPALRPQEYEFTLTVLSTTQDPAFSVGAGRTYVDQGFLDSTLADRRSDREQLAFVLAHELGSSGPAVLVLDSGLATARLSIARTLKGKEESFAGRFAQAGLDELVLPAEIRNGDLCVTLDSAALDGVAAVHTKRIRHNRLPRDAELMERVVELLVAQE